MYFYNVVFTLANEKKAAEIDLSNHLPKFEAAASNFNDAGSHAKNYKRIVAQRVTPTTLEIIFKSKSKIGAPTMCFQNYSSYLIDTFGLQDWKTASGAFWKGIAAKELTEEEALKSELSFTESEVHMSNLDMSKKILDLCFENPVENARERRRREGVIQKIKTLLADYYKEIGGCDNV